MSSEKEEEDLLDKEATLRKALFNLSLQIKHLLHDRPNSPSTKDNGGRVKLPKIDVPTFNRNILHWTTFWEQFKSVHSL